jgi:hypothetical protein
MSVRTTFDDRKEEVKDYLGKAINKLQECTKEETWGYEDIKPEFIDELIQMIADLTKMKRKL